MTWRAGGPAIKTVVAGFSSNTILLCQNDAQTLHFGSTVENCFASAVYQWQISIDGGVTWKDIPGANGQTYDRLAPVPGNYFYRMTAAAATNTRIHSVS